MRDEKRGFDKMLNYIWKHDVNKLNDHLPSKTVALSELLSLRQPAIKTRDGTNFWIDKDELKRIASLVPSRLHTELHLPIILIRRMDLGEGIFSIGGGKLEAYFAAKMLGITQEPFDHYESADIPQYIYRPQVQELRRKLRSLSVIGFGGVDREDLEET
jgi:uncharacterized protein (UPF0216 family)